MVEDEQLFYKWVNSLLVAYPFQSALGTGEDKDSTSAVAATASSHAGSRALAESFPSLSQQIQTTQAIFQTNLAAYQQLSKSFELEWKHWRQEKQRSRAHLQQMEMKMERIAQEVTSRELFDPQKLFLQSAQSWSAQQNSRSEGRGDNGRKQKRQQFAFPCEQELEGLRSQLERVLREISTEYCQAQLL